MNITDLPSEILCDIFKQFDSLHTLQALSQTCTRFKYLLSELIVVICDDKKSINASKPFDLDNLTHINIMKISLNVLAALTRKYHYFIFNFSPEETSNLTNQIKVLKLILRNLQEYKIRHTIYINSKNYCMNPLIRFLLPKLNSPYTEFYFPYVKKIQGFDDLRLLDNTNCYFSQLESMTVGSFSFQLFNLKAPKLKVFNHSAVILARTFSENVSTARISYSKFLDSLFCSNLECLEVIGTVAQSILYKFSSVKILRIYSDNSSQSFDLQRFGQLEELVISKCSKLSHLKNLLDVNKRLHFIDLSNNRNFDQQITGDFTNLRTIDLSNTGIHDFPYLGNHGSSYNLKINVDGCKNLVKSV